MDSITSLALEEICISGPTGIPVGSLWSKLSPSLFAFGLDLCPGVKSALWSALLSVPSLQFVAPNAIYSGGDLVVQPLEVAEGLGLRIVAEEHLRDSFFGIHDPPATGYVLSPSQRHVLELLGAARTNGITQSELAKELGINGNNFFYIVRRLESQGLVTKHSTLVRTKDVNDEGDSSYSSVVNTNMIYLSRYSKHLGSHQRLEIKRKDCCLSNLGNMDEHVPSGDSAARNFVGEEMHVKDNLSELKAICDKLEEANEMVLLVSDIKKDLGYRFATGHRRWRNICKELIDAGFVEMFLAKVNKKEARCLRLLKKFSPTSFEKETVGFPDDSFEEHLVNVGHRDRITEQMVELPLEYRVYDMIDVEGPAGLTVTEICRRLGINSKKNHKSLYSMFARFGMHLQPEFCNRVKVYRVWTPGNFFPDHCIVLPSVSRNLLIENAASDMPVGNACFNEHAEQLTSLTSIGNTVTSDKVNCKEAQEDISNGHSRIADDTHMVSLYNNSDELIDNGRDLVPHAVFDVMSVVTESNSSLSKAVPSTCSKPSRCRSYELYPCLSLTAINAHREQKILEMLQEEKFILRAELHRWLDGLELDRSTGMDRKTLVRILNKLQKLGNCRCINITVPAATNYNRSRIAQVVLHPSIQGLPPDILGQIHDRMRSFDKEVRREGLPRLKNKLNVCVLNDMHRIHNDVDNGYQSYSLETMRANGFVIAKMVRVKLLHGFLWDYINNMSGIWDTLSSGSFGCNVPYSHSTCQPFELDGAIKAIPLDLFLQVVGTSRQFENRIDKYKSASLLSDLPLQEYKLLMGTHATGRLSWLLDILRRLKLIRVLIDDDQSEDAHRPSHARLTHAMELKPYIEEPLTFFAPSSNFISLDLRPRRRHDFILSNRKAVEIYWKTLEFCYSVADPRAALHAFPGSSVREVFGKRSWAPVHPMTVKQRAELLNRIISDDPIKKMCFPECEKIAKDLCLTLEQVLRFHYQKQRQYLRRSQKGLNHEKEEFQCLEEYSLAFSGKQKKSSKRQLLKLDTVAVQLVDPVFSKPCENPSKSDGRNFHGTLTEELDINLQSYHEDDHLKDMGKHGSVEDEANDSSLNQYPFLKIKPPQQKQFKWTEEADRQLIIQYVRHRVVLGAKFHRVDWKSLIDLPAPKNCCKRRIQLLKSCVKVRSSIMRLCNLLAERFAKHLNNTFQYKNGNRPAAQGMAGKVFNRSECIEHTKVSDLMEQPWDNFDNENIKLALEEVLRHKKIAKLEVSRQIGYVSSKWSDQNSEGFDPYRDEVVSSGTPSEFYHNCSRKLNPSSQKTIHRCLPLKFIDSSNGRIIVEGHAYESLAVSNAIELFKLIFLATPLLPEIQNLFVEILRRYSVHDLSTAFNYLKDKKITVGGDGSNLVLSPQFKQNISSSPFPTDTGRRASRFSNWLHKHERHILEEGICLDEDLQCGEILLLFSLVSIGELSVSPCLPDEGYGEAQDSKNIKRKADNNELYTDIAKRLKPSLINVGDICSRKTKGFPGMKVSVRREMISVVDDRESRDLIICDGSLPNYENDPLNLIYGQKIDGNASRFDHISEIGNHEIIIHVTGEPNESIWESMTGYAKYVASLHSDGKQAGQFSPELFQTVYSAIQRAGDQGLCMEEVSHVLQRKGENLSEIIVEVLEAFGRTVKVNAYDSVHIVDALYQSKYFLASMNPDTEECSSPPLLKLPWTSVPGCFNLQPGNKDFHRITILNHPEEVVHPLDNIQQCESVEGFLEADNAKTYELFSTDSKSFRPILPWLNGDGSINDVVYKGLIRSVIGTVMQNPGILEDDLIRRMHVLNPQSCRKLVELMILDNHLMVRKMHQTTSDSPPPILATLFGTPAFDNCRSVYRDHFFANPLSTFLL